MSEIKNDPVNRRIEGCYIENTIKYIRRWKKKNDLEDLKKARMYLNCLIDHEEKKHPHHSGPKPFSEMTKEDTKRELNRIYGVPHEEATRIKMESVMADLKDLWEFLSESEKEKKEPPKIGEYCCCESKMRESSDPEPNRPRDIVEIIWTEFCRVFCEALKEVSEEDKETLSVIDRLNQSQVCQTSSLINETILKEKEKKDEE